MSIKMVDSRFITPNPFAALANADRSTNRHNRKKTHSLPAPTPASASLINLSKNNQAATSSSVASLPQKNVRKISSSSFSLGRICLLALSILVILSNPALAADTSNSSYPVSSSPSQFRLTTGGKSWGQDIYSTQPVKQESSEDAVNRIWKQMDSKKIEQAKDPLKQAMIAALGGGLEDENWLETLPKLSADKIKVITQHMALGKRYFYTVDPNDMSSSVMSGHRLIKTTRPYDNKYFVAIRVKDVDTCEVFADVFHQKFDDGAIHYNAWISQPGRIFLGHQHDDVSLYQEDRNLLTRLVHGMTVEVNGRRYCLA